MVLLILESLGSTELVFILIMALVFFGPRKLPQLSRSMGKHLADFRRASEDFKRTWDREVSLEDAGNGTSSTNRFELSEENSILDAERASDPSQGATPMAVAPDQVIARHALAAETIHDSGETDSASFSDDGLADETKHSPKSDWL